MSNPVKSKLDEQLDRFQEMFNRCRELIEMRSDVHKVDMAWPELEVSDKELLLSLAINPKAHGVMRFDCNAKPKSAAEIIKRNFAFFDSLDMGAEQERDTKTEVVERHPNNTINPKVDKSTQVLLEAAGIIVNQTKQIADLKESADANAVLLLKANAAVDGHLKTINDQAKEIIGLNIRAQSQQMEILQLKTGAYKAKVEFQCAQAQVNIADATRRIAVSAMSAIDLSQSMTSKPAPTAPVGNWFSRLLDFAEDKFLGLVIVLVVVLMLFMVALWIARGMS